MSMMSKARVLQGPMVDVDRACQLHEADRACQQLQADRARRLLEADHGCQQLEAFDAPLSMKAQREGRCNQ
jgi:hypothetical protein